MFPQVLRLSDSSSVYRNACATADVLHSRPPANPKQAMQAQQLPPNLLPICCSPLIFHQAVCDSLPDDPEAIGHLDGDTAVSRGTFSAALAAAGATCAAVDEVMTGRVSVASAHCWQVAHVNEVMSGWVRPCLLLWAALGGNR